MNKKTIIQLIIIMGAFGGAGLVLYNGFFSGQSIPQPTTATATPENPESILPNGDFLDFNILDKKRFEYDQIKYPQLDPQSDVGVFPEENLIHGQSAVNP